MWIEIERGDGVDCFLNCSKSAASTGKSRIAVGAERTVHVVGSVCGEEFTPATCSSCCVRQGDGTCRAVDDDGFVPGRPIGAHLYVPVVVARETELRVSNEVGLKHDACRVSCRSLVDLETVIVALMAKQAGRARDGEPVRRIRDIVDADQRHWVHVSSSSAATPARYDGKVCPFGSRARRRRVRLMIEVAVRVGEKRVPFVLDKVAGIVAHRAAPGPLRNEARAAAAWSFRPSASRIEVEAAFVVHPSQPPRDRRIKGPSPVLPRRDVARMARPRACGTCADDVACTGSWARGRRAEVFVRDGELNDRVESSQRLVVGHMLLRLARHDIGEGKIFGVVHELRLGEGCLAQV